MNKTRQKTTPIHFVPRHCSQCGHPLIIKFIKDENRKRLFCRSCGYINYLNPLVVAGAIPVMNDRVILIRRGIEPARGLWTYPAGFVEMKETIAQAAVREAKEETGFKISARGLLGIYSYEDAGVVTIVYRADVIGGAAMLCKESMEIKEFTAKNIPWKSLAFRSTKDALKDWVAGKK